MRFRALLPVLLAATLLHAARESEATGPRSGHWAHEGGARGAVAPDPRVTWGRLDNGFRYALRPHAGVPGSVTLQLLVLTGSVDERADELGIAHFTEHMVFGGSKNFRAEDMVALFHRLGIEFGSDVNANTSFDHTAYRLGFRENDPALLRDGLRLFRDFADAVNFDPPKLESERRIVLAELRDRDTLRDRQQMASLPLLFRGLRFAERGPGGDAALLKKFTREQFLAFYHRCYRPDLMVLVGAGDFEPAAITAMVREVFGGLAPAAGPVPARDEGKLDARALRAGIYRINGVGQAEVTVASVAALPTGADTRASHIEAQRRRFVMEVFAERLRTQLPEGGGAGAGYEDILGHGAAMATLHVPAPAWAAGVTALDQMVRHTLAKGLDPVDIDNARRRQLRLAGHAAELAPRADPEEICEALTDSIVTHRVFVGAETEHAWMREWLERTTPAEAQQVFRALWAPESLAVHVAGGVDFELTPEKILAQVQKTRRVGATVQEARKRRDPVFPLPKFAAPTEVVERREVPALGAQLLRFGNNTRLNFAANRAEPGLVRVVVRVGNGLLELPGKKPALKEFALNSVLAAGAVHCTPELLGALVGERFLEFGLDATDRDAFAFRGLVAAEQLETLLGLIADFLHQPRFSHYVLDDEKERAAMGRAAGSVGLSDGLRALTDHLFKGDARFTSGSPLDYVSMGVMDARRWLEEPLAHGYVEATIVGDVTEAAAGRIFSRTLGALAPRAAEKKLSGPPRPAAVSARPGFTRIEFVGEQNLGLCVATWPVTDPVSVRDQAALEVLAKVLEQRIRAEVREKLGFAYSPSAQFEAFDGFPGLALMQAQIDCAPDDAGRIAPVVAALAARIASDGVTEGEFTGSRGILRSQLARAFRENSFLVSALMRAQERPAETAELVELRRGLAGQITREEVNAWAAKILPGANCRSAAVTPKAFIGFMEAAK